MRLGIAWTHGAGRQGRSSRPAVYCPQGHNPVKSGRVLKSAEAYGTVGFGRVRSGIVQQSLGSISMPKRRQDSETWAETRRKVWERDQGRCQGPYCKDTLPWSLPLDACHIDHIRSGKLGSNHLSNLRVLCRRCHVLRSDFRHRGMISAALRDGVIPPDWRLLVWDG